LLSRIRRPYRKTIAWQLKVVQTIIQDDTGHHTKSVEEREFVKISPIKYDRRIVGSRPVPPDVWELVGPHLGLPGTG
jgi:hypothetical protein